MPDHAGEFKQAMRRLASTIALLTSGRDGVWCGMAATAVMSVTADPPTLSIAVNKNASLHPAVVETGAFCVNLLGASHASLVPLFSGALKGTDRFQHGNWRASAHGLPILDDAVASMICTVTDRLDTGTHSIFIGTVSEVANHPRIDPLLWVDGDVAVTQKVEVVLAPV